MKRVLPGIVFGNNCWDLEVAGSTPVTCSTFVHNVPKWSFNMAAIAARLQWKGFKEPPSKSSTRMEWAHNLFYLSKVIFLFVCIFVVVVLSTVSFSVFSMVWEVRQVSDSAVGVGQKFGVSGKNKVVSKIYNWFQMGNSWVRMSLQWIYSNFHVK